MPPDHGFGLDDDEWSSPVLPDAAEENPDHAVLVFQAQDEFEHPKRLPGALPQVQIRHPDAINVRDKNHGNL